MKNLEFFVQSVDSILDAFWNCPIFFRKSGKISDKEIQKAHDCVNQFYKKMEDSSIQPYRDSSDAGFFRNDWEKLGNDMRNAINEYATRTR